jgi:hypothetical protein
MLFIVYVLKISGQVLTTVQLDPGVQKMPSDLTPPLSHACLCLPSFLPGWPPLTLTSVLMSKLEGREKTSQDSQWASILDQKNSRHKGCVVESRLMWPRMRKEAELK